MHSKIRWLGLIAMTVGGCGDDDVSTDASRLPDGALRCMESDECSDGVFCNGAETCADGVCIQGELPCAAPLCDEDRRACAGCPDDDGDGFEDLACGGSDCDDDDASRHPGGTEICDAMDVDEDCDPTTFGVRDADEDGVADAACCNGSTCGRDCDDTSSAVSPSVPETCDMLDNDCDGMVDETVLSMYFPDAVGDGFGDPAGELRQACAASSGYVDNDDDCNDESAAINPSTPEVCDALDIDENCNGTVNEGCGCPSIGRQQNCGSPQALAGTGECSPGLQTCEAMPGGAAWSDCLGNIEPDDETCGGGDEDCDGMTNESSAVDAATCYRDADNDTYAPAGAATMRACACPVGFTARATPLDCDDTGPVASSVFPGATETCNHVDNDCDGDFDELISEAGCNFSRSSESLSLDASRWHCSHSSIFAACSAAPYTRSEGRTQTFPYFTNNTTGSQEGALVSLPESVEFTHRVQVAAAFWLRGTPAQGHVAVWVAPVPADNRRPFPTSVATGVGGAPPFTNTLAAVFNVTTRRLEIYRHTGSGFTRLAQSAPASTACALAPATEANPANQGVTFEMIDGAASARLRCGSPTVQAEVSATIADWRTAYYLGPQYPRFWAGASGASDGGLDSGFYSFFLERTPGTDGNQGACDACRAYGVPGLSY